MKVPARRNGWFPHLIRERRVFVSTIRVMLHSGHEKAYCCCAPSDGVRWSSVCRNNASPPPSSSPPSQSLVRPIRFDQGNRCRSHENPKGWPICGVGQSCCILRRFFSGALVTSDTIRGTVLVLQSSHEEDCSCRADARGVCRTGVRPA